MLQNITKTWTSVPGMVPLVIPKPYSNMSNPMMTIRNECLTSQTFRKVHIEYAIYGDLDIIAKNFFGMWLYVKVMDASIKKK